MCGIVGMVDFHKNIKKEEKTLTKMIKTLERRGPDSEGEYYSDNVLLGHRRLIVVDPVGGRQPMIKVVGGKKYIIVYNGELYNTEDLRKELLEENYTFEAYCDTEVLLTAYIAWGINVVNKLNGIFAFAIYDEDKKQVFLARDPMGVKPLFYSKKGSKLIFGSEIKTILAHPEVRAEIDRDGLTELFALGPAVAPGSAVYKGINEIAPANCMLLTKDSMKIWEYWKVEAKELNETADESVSHVRELLIDAIKRQLVGDVPVCTFLSGGLDSSAISAIAAADFKEKGKRLTTYSIDYEGNDKYFKSSLFQPTSDQYFAEKMAKFIDSDHRTVLLKQEDLAYSLREATLSRDLPGMADVDSSLLLFCKEIRKDFVVGLSGECADELFAGYPWFTHEEMINANTFPWSRSVGERKTILNDNLKNIKIEELTNEELFYLNLKWFMVNLLNRKDRSSMYNSLEVRVPFADYRIVDYAFNLPVDVKLLEGREKGLLRKALVGILPEEIVYRKKSPYPKTHNPIYTNIVCSMMNEILDDKTSPILQIINKDKIKEIVDTKGVAYKTPWFGQLMTGPQMIAYLIQVDTWLREYNVNILI